ncbi:MAG TPA: hypothetical protein VD905_21240 [Flavobacteriales bacterium]|nr:hypothetical protein [Flavobacteriales bacterium]
MISRFKRTIPVLLLLLSGNVFSQSNWEFVGPHSHNDINPSGLEFETSQLNRVVIDPLDEDHLFVGGVFGGLWESTDRGQNWTNVNANSCGFNGVLALTFLSSTELLVGNYHVGYNPGTGSMDNSTGICKYDFVNQTWSSLTALPYSAQTYVIKNIAVYPGNPQLLFACTSVGLFRSTDGGASWGTGPVSSTVNTYVQSMVFVQKSGGGYYCYISGSHALGGLWGEPVGAAMFMESNDDGQTFTDYSSNITMGCNPIENRAHCMLTLGQQTNSNGDRDIFLLSTQTPGTPQGWDPYGWDNYAGQFFLDKITKNINSPFSLNFTPLNPAPACSTGFGGYGGTRIALAFDPLNNRLWFGGQVLNYYDLNTGNHLTHVNRAFHSRGGYIHDDMHDIQVQKIWNSSTGVYDYGFIAHDGGLVWSALGTNSSDPLPHFYPMNNGLHVCLINGFSGSQSQPNLYALGGGDIVNTDVYDANIQENIYTHQTWENDGALIDKFNDANMIFDANMYVGYATTGWCYHPADYYTSNDGGASKLAGNYYDPATGGTFSIGSIEPQQDAQGFTSKQYYQDPYRPNRIFHGKGYSYANQYNDNTCSKTHGIGISQYDFTNRQFVVRWIPLLLAPNANTSSRPATSDWFNEAAPIKGMSFSPQTINSLHFLISATGWPTNSPPAIIKYTGNNLDDVWVGHNDSYNSGNPQWVNIVPNFSSLSTMLNCGSCINVVGTDFYSIDFKDIETSPWNKDVVYVLLHIPNNPGVIILKYDGTQWSNYSQGLPSTEYPFSMIMDHATNDGIYLSTDVGIYFRDASMSNWVPYKTGLPLTFSKQMEINYTENTVRAGVFGRGIWKSPLSCPTTTNPLQLTTPIAANYYESANVVASSNITSQTKPTAFRGTNSVTLNPRFIASGISTDNTYCLAYIHGCTGGSTSPFWRTGEFEEIVHEETDVDQQIIVFPNPNNGQFTIKINKENETENNPSAEHA